MTRCFHLDIEFKVFSVFSSPTSLSHPSARTFLSSSLKDKGQNQALSSLTSFFPFLPKNLVFKGNEKQNPELRFEDKSRKKGERAKLGENKRDMRPNHQQTAQSHAVGFSPCSSSSSAAANKSRPRRRADLTLLLPQLDPPLAVPPPLISPSTNSSNANETAADDQQVNLSELERVNRIGSGTGGTVYKVVHRPSSRAFALRVIYGNHEESIRRQIRKEIEIHRDVDHPNVVKCHEMYDHNGEIQVLLEFMDGGSLQGTHISQEPNLSDLARQILSALDYLHRRQIVHRNIKPSNLLINSENKAKIADFGVSRILDQTMDPCNSSVGTIAYMSPERINTDSNHGLYDGYAGDIWSLGVSILEFYLGRFPFAVGRQGDWASLMCAICMSQPPEAPPSASDEFRHFISCCLQRDPAKRWSAAQLLQHPFIVKGQLGQNHAAQNLDQ